MRAGDNGGSARLPGGGSNTFGDLQAAIIIAHVKWLPTGAVLGCHDDISRGDRARGPAATAHGWLTARCHITARRDIFSLVEISPRAQEIHWEIYRAIERRAPTDAMDATRRHLEEMETYVRRMLSADADARQIPGVGS